MLQILFMKEV